MPDRHFYQLRHHIFFSIKFLLFCCLAPNGNQYFPLMERGILRRLWFLIRGLFRHKKIARDADRKNKTPYINVSSLEFNFPEDHSLLAHSMLLNSGFRQSEKRNTALSQMRLRSVFKMRTSILNTATTEQMGQGSISFFVYTKSTNQYFYLPIKVLYNSS